MAKIYPYKAFFSVICLSFLTALCSSTISAQAVSDWTLQSEEHGVRLYSSTMQCAGKQMLLLRFENTNQDDKHVNYNIILESEGHNMPLLPKSIRLKGGETRTGACDAVRELTTDIKNITHFKMLVVMTVN